MNSANLLLPDLERFFADDTLCHAVTLTFDPLTLKVCGTWRIMWSKSVRNSTHHYGLTFDEVIAMSAWLFLLEHSVLRDKFEMLTFIASA